MPTKNLVTDFGAVADAVRQTLTCSITSGTNALTVGTSVFVVGDIGKALTIWHSSLSNGALVTTISGFTSGTEITLGNNATATLSSASCDVLWGTDNANAFVGASGSYRAWARTQTDTGDPPILEIPDGNYYWKCSQATNASLHYNVLNNPTIRGASGTAANCKIMQGNTGELRFGNDPAVVGNAGIDAPNGLANSVRLETAAAGASSVFVVDPGTYGSRIVVGRCVLIAAFDMQGGNNGQFGYPPNSYFYEWNKITAYNSGTGEVTLETPLTQQYKSTYPEWGNRTTIFGCDQGGPATMWVTPPGYEYTITLEDFTVDSPHNQAGAATRHLVISNLVMNGPGLYPSSCDTFTATDCTYTQELEVDKLTNTVTWNNCTLVRAIQQSASPNRMIFNNCTIEKFDATKYSELNNVTFTGDAQVQTSVAAYGRTNRIVMNNCTGIALFGLGGATIGDLTTTDGTPQRVDEFFEFNAGVMRFLKTQNHNTHGQANPTRGLVPGTWVWFDQRYLDQVVDVYEDGTYCYVQWLNTTDWPYSPVDEFKVHACPDFTMTNCTGTAPELEDWNNRTPRLPMYSYSKRTYVGGPSSATPSTARPTLHGTFVSETITVVTPYVGAGSLSMLDAQFKNRPYYTPSNLTSAATDFGSSVNAKISGTRVIRAATTPTGTQASDDLEDLTAEGEVIFVGTSNSYPVWSANVTNGETPTVTIEYIMDQGIPPAIPTAVVPLRLRLRA
jgi:hypothetical protein